jgi:CheY-like chemotaxis protein
MHAHFGGIEAASAGPGQGAKFSVWMPVLRGDEAPAEVAQPVRSDEKATRSLSILLLEDHADSAEVMARILRSLGHSVEVGGTIAEGLAALRARTFDLVLSDIGLPDGTGLEFIAQARAFCSTPMIAITGYGMEDDVTKHHDAGFLRQLTKPIRYDQLEEAIADFARGGGSANAPRNA